MRDRIFVEFDKAGAEWVVVAYLAGDARMIEICQSGRSPHPITGHYMTGAPIELIEKEARKEYIGMMNDPVEIERIRREKLPELFGPDVFFLPRGMSIRQCGKKSNHGLNYMEGPAQFALMNEMDESEARKIVNAYSHDVYPGVSLWWEAIKRQLRKDRTLENCFGRKRTFLDRWDNNLIKSAVSFIPQSTVSDMVVDGMIKSYNDPEISSCWSLGANVYDSLLFQVDFSDYKRLAAQCIKVGLDFMNAECEYGGRSFRIGTDLKIGRSWGKMIELKLTKDVDKVAADITKILAGNNAKKAA